MLNIGFKDKMARYMQVFVSQMRKEINFRPKKISQEHTIDIIRVTSLNSIPFTKREIGNNTCQARFKKLYIRNNIIIRLLM